MIPFCVGGLHDLTKFGKLVIWPTCAAWAILSGALSVADRLKVALAFIGWHDNIYEVAAVAAIVGAASAVFQAAKTDAIMLDSVYVMTTTVCVNFVQLWLPNYPANFQQRLAKTRVVD